MKRNGRKKSARATKMTPKALPKRLLQHILRVFRPLAEFWRVPGAAIPGKSMVSLRRERTSRKAAWQTLVTSTSKTSLLVDLGARRSERSESEVKGGLNSPANTPRESPRALWRIPVRYAKTAGPRAFEESIAAKATMKRRYVVNFFISLFVPMILRSETSNLQHIRVSQK